MPNIVQTHTNTFIQKSDEYWKNTEFADEYSAARNKTHTALTKFFKRKETQAKEQKKARAQEEKKNKIGLRPMPSSS